MRSLLFLLIALLGVIRGAKVCIYTDSECTADESCYDGCYTNGNDYSSQYRLKDEVLFLYVYDNSDCSGDPSSEQIVRTGVPDGECQKGATGSYVVSQGWHHAGVPSVVVTGVALCVSLGFLR
uniref:Uncharacterized protein n=1 Tax=Chromera velia CCMP2878 TaxID=1169474 RepID=A0A0G4I9A6_9ALVE|mmetsp:Transcript_16250/g.32929  ORF Transcript_16250/g.32929 Transcript_16250/m.32929 type:complete len:123 (+) Transcript_16250:549-917(+)|eukprot:Cvel_12192.t1-p1 / transcript=Cvel_12192.t1 / gene=Cvel_12192 / organism=Chromera_velia_CCMP2878 / gene_product=hypothetical protein / transcript_product=hypothetical protein / location=Cvel_scaffold788:16673-17038(-) / protein_length=122 / sequence_SO=supercontig / SO=protein_coding / is_pseudo=false